MKNASSIWEQLKDCTPKLTAVAEFESRQERRQRWLIVRNKLNGDHVRLNESAAKMVSCLDGETSIEQLCEESGISDADATDISNWLATLCHTGLVSLGSGEDNERLLSQYHSRSKYINKSRFSNPLALRFPLHNPDRWLDALVKNLEWLFSKTILIIMLCFIALAAMAAYLNAGLILQEGARVASSPQHWWLYGLIYPFLKAIHELSHALLIKRWGGAVHETGITFLVLIPIPYVDASDAWMFPQRYQRVLVGSAGMIAECFLAAIGLFVFLTVQPGLVKDLGFGVMLLGSIATILFNANPLLKFDGYYILQDWLEMPNLGSRANRYCRYLFRKYVYRVQDADRPVVSSGERRWLVSYAVLAFAYRCFITVYIALFLASKFFVLGVMLGIFALHQFFVKPIFKLSSYLRDAGELDNLRTRAVSLTAGTAIALATLVVLLPMPSSTRTEGVVWVPNQAQVFANHSAVIKTLYVESGSMVRAGEPLMHLYAADLDTELVVAQARLDALKIEHRATQHADKHKAQTLLADVRSLEGEVAALERESAALSITAEIDGMFVLEEKVEIAGQHVEQGELLAYVVNQDALVVRAVLQQQRMGRVQAGVTRAQVRVADQFEKSMEASLTRQTPAASNTLPSPALAYDGRSGIAVATTTGDKLETLESVFHIELSLPDDARIAGIGGRAYVTLHHEPESLGKRWWRSTRQLLLRQLTV